MACQYRGVLVNWQGLRAGTWTHEEYETVQGNVDRLSTFGITKYSKNTTQTAITKYYKLGDQRTTETCSSQFGGWDVVIDRFSGWWEPNAWLMDAHLRTITPTVEVANEPSGTSFLRALNAIHEGSALVT